LLEAGAGIDMRERGVEEALMAAARGGHNEVVMLLLARGANPAAVNYCNRPVPSYALEGGCSRATFDLLLKSTPKDLLDTTDDGGPTTLGLAAQRGDIHAAKLLLAAGASLNAGGRNNTPLWLAIEEEMEDMARFLLDAGSDVNETPMQWALIPLAVDMGLDRTLNLLLARGADPTFVPPSGDKPLDNAVSNHYYRCAKLLLDAGALASYETDNFDEMLYPLIVMDDDMAIPLAEKLAITGFPYNGEALLWAARNGNQRIIEPALEHGADIETGADFDPPITPLMVAAILLSLDEI
jgi:ankyrin repeat protein